MRAGARTQLMLSIFLDRQLSVGKMALRTAYEKQHCIMQQLLYTMLKELQQICLSVALQHTELHKATLRVLTGGTQQLYQHL